MLNAPVLGPLIHQLASGRVAETLGALLQGGVPVLAAIDTAGQAAGNLEVTRRLARARDRVAIGSSVAAALAAERALVDHTVRLAALGDASGKLGEMLSKAGELAMTEGERRIQSMISLIEPVMILGFALVIGFVAAALLQAVYALRPGGGP